jgi:DNA repair photolyase
MPTQYVEVPARTILNRIPHDRYGFHWSMNLYRGCRHGCPFCYARHTHQFLGYDNPRDFQEVVEVKVNAPELLAQELSAHNWRREPVALGTATDSYQPAERTYHLTRQALILLARFRTPALISTKSDLVTRDIDILQRLTQRSSAVVAMSIMTPDVKLSRWLEPWAVSIRARFKALEVLKEAGISTGLHMMPILPGINDDDESLATICRMAAEVGVDYLSHSHLHLRGKVVRDYFLRQLQHYDADIYRRYQNMFDHSRETPWEWRQDLDERIARFRMFYGLQSERHFMEERDQQMELFSV